ncbi:hypothetical protein ACVWXO_010935 [Bradyrhizobium sp. LM2.7]
MRQAQALSHVVLAKARTHCPREKLWREIVVTRLRQTRSCGYGPGLRQDDGEFVVSIYHQTRSRSHSSRAFENANELTRRVVSSKISVRVIGGSARWAQFSRSHSRQLTPIGVPSVFSRSMPEA